MMDNWLESRLEGGVVQVNGTHRTARLHDTNTHPTRLPKQLKSKKQLSPSLFLTKHSLMSRRVIRRYNNTSS
jgi:hypothetical protein